MASKWEAQVEASKQALDAIILFAGHYASGPEGQRQFQEVIKVLKVRGPLCANIAVAIDAFLHNKSVEPIKRS